MLKKQGPTISKESRKKLAQGKKDTSTLRLVSIADVKQITRQGKEWRHNMRITDRLRPEFNPGGTSAVRGLAPLSQEEDNEVKAYTEAESDDERKSRRNRLSGRDLMASFGIRKEEDSDEGQKLVISLGELLNE